MRLHTRESGLASPARPRRIATTRFRALFERAPAAANAPRSAAACSHPMPSDHHCPHLTDQQRRPINPASARQASTVAPPPPLPSFTGPLPGPVPCATRWRPAQTSAPDSTFTCRPACCTAAHLRSPEPHQCARTRRSHSPRRAATDRGTPNSIAPTLPSPAAATSSTGPPPRKTPNSRVASCTPPTEPSRSTTPTARVRSSRSGSDAHGPRGTRPSCSAAAHIAAHSLRDSRFADGDGGGAQDQKWQQRGTGRHRGDHVVAVATHGDVGGGGSYPSGRRHRVRLITARGEPGRLTGGVDATDLRRRREEGTETEHDGNDEAAKAIAASTVTEP